MCVDPDDREAAGARREPPDRADVGAAAASEHERARRQVPHLGRDLLLEGLLLDHGCLGIRQRQRRRGRHRLASLTPGAGHPHEPGGELAAAAVALVLHVDRDRGQRPAVGAAGAQRAHAMRSHVSLRRTTCIPTRS